MINLTGVYILHYSPPPGGGEKEWKNMFGEKRWREKRGKKEKKGGKKRKKGENGEKRGKMGENMKKKVKKSPLDPTKLGKKKISQDRGRGKKVILM